MFLQIAGLGSIGIATTAISGTLLGNTQEAIAQQSPTTIKPQPVSPDEALKQLPSRNHALLRVSGKIRTNRGSVCKKLLLFNIPLPQF